MLSRRSFRLVLPLFLIAGLLIFLLVRPWNRKSRELIYRFVPPAQLLLNSSSSKGPNQDIIAYATILPQEIDWTRLLDLIESLQMHILLSHESAEIIVFYSSNSASMTAAALSLYNFVKPIPMDGFNDPRKRVHTISQSMPYILEYLLIDHELAVVINYDQLIDEGAISKVLNTIAIHGEVVVPPNDYYAGRTTGLNPAIANKPVPLLAYTRAGYAERVKPWFDCLRGLWCPPGEGWNETSKKARASTLRSDSVLKSSSLGLRRGDQVGKKSGLLMNPQFEVVLTKEDVPSQAQTHTIRIGLGLEVVEGESGATFRETKLIPLFNSLGRQNQSAYHIFIYILLLSGSISRADLLKNIKSLRPPSRVNVKLSLTPIPKELSNVVLEAIAWQDSCESLAYFGTPLVLPNASWLERIARYSSLRKLDRLVLIIQTDGNDSVWMLKELVGSIHSLLEEYPMESPPLLVVLGRKGLNRHDIAMIRLWEHVEYYDVDELFFGFSLSEDNRLDDERLMRLMLLDMFIKRYGSAVWIKSSVFFADVLEETSPLLQLSLDLITKGLIRVGSGGELVMEGYDESMFSRLFAEFRECVIRLDCSSTVARHREIVASTSPTKYGLQNLLPQPTDPSEREQMYCHLSIRPEIMYNPQLFAAQRNSITQWASPSEDEQIWRAGAGSRSRIAFLIPSKNGAQEEPEKVHLLQTFFKSLLSTSTANEWSRYQYNIYVGYDEGDPVLDQRRLDFVKAMNDMRGEAHRRDVLFKLHRLPMARCVTLLWNLLFLDAVADGNDYFYQVNDDVALLDAGWTNKFVSKLRENDDFGVVGPNDRLWNCNLLTQSFVSRTHWKIFGWYYPIAIKDWYSDNWISEVYGPDHTHCIRDAAVRNGATGTRYNICDKPKWREAVAEGKKTIEQWKRHQLQG